MFPLIKGRTYLVSMYERGNCHFEKRGVYEEIIPARYKMTEEDVLRCYFRNDREYMETSKHFNHLVQRLARVDRYVFDTCIVPANIHLRIEEV